MDSLGILKSLLDRNANPNLPLTGVIAPRGALDGADRIMGPGATALLRAAKSADLTALRLLLEHGAEPHYATKDHTTALMLAAGAGWRDGKSNGTEANAIEAIKQFLELGADINASNDKGETALHGAATRGADKIVQFLGDNGINLYAKDKQGRTALDTALGVGADAAGVRAPHESTVALLRKLMDVPSDPGKN
jgi:ankyrin repeat protein